MKLCQNASCSQHPPLYQTGFNTAQGCTHYCKICGWGYWTHIIKPTDEQIKTAEKLYPKYTKALLTDMLTWEIVKPKPPGIWGKGSVEKTMLKYLGEFQPYWLSDKLKKIWKAKYKKSIESETKTNTT